MADASHTSQTRLQLRVAVSASEQAVGRSNHDYGCDGSRRSGAGQPPRATRRASRGVCFGAAWSLLRCLGPVRRLAAGAALGLRFEVS
jgi:hypothetical protein